MRPGRAVLSLGLLVLASTAPLLFAGRSAWGLWATEVRAATIPRPPSVPGSLYAYNKNNPRWETEGRGGAPHQFHKPYRPLRQPPGAVPPREHGGRHASVFLSPYVLIGLASILVLSVVAEWVSWALRTPSTLVLLVFGLVAGALTGFVDPDGLLGNMMLPVASLSLAVILFHTGLRLRRTELRQIRVSLGVPLAAGVLLPWLIGAAAAYLVVGVQLPTAILLGAIIVMVGPAGIATQPRHLRGKRLLTGVVKGEGTGLELIGITLTVLVFEAILAGGARQAALPGLIGMVEAIVIGGASGALGALALVQLRGRRWVPDRLENVLALALVIFIFTLANLLEEEAGFLAVVVMGMSLANQRAVNLQRVTQFMGHICALVGPALLLALAARLRLHDAVLMGAAGLAFLGAVLLIARPAAVLLATMRCGLGWRERMLLTCGAPRGIIAAAAASILALRIVEIGDPQAQTLVPATFLVVAATAATSGVATLVGRRWLRLPVATASTQRPLDVDPRLTTALRGLGRRRSDV